MLDAHLKSPVTRQRLRSGPAADHVDSFADWLHRRGYKPASSIATLPLTCRLDRLDAIGWVHRA